jgi:hypothetical protein
MTTYTADYPANYQPLANDAADSSFRGNPMAMFYEGGRVGTKPVRIVVPREPQNYAKGGLAAEARRVRDAGVGGDELIIHINRKEYDELVKNWGEPTINPHTGMPQFTPFWKQKWFAPGAAIASAALMATGIGAPLGAALLPASFAGTTIAGAALPSVLGNALIGAGVGGLTGGAKGALLGGALGGFGTIGAGALGATGAGVTGTGSEGFSGWWSRMGAGDYFGAAGTGGAQGAAGSGKLFPMNALDPNPAAVGAYGPTIPPGAEAAYAAANPAYKVAGASTGILGSLGGAKTVIPAALLAASAMGGKQQAVPDQAGGAESTDPNLTKRLDMAPLYRPQLAGPANYYTYGAGPENTFFGAPVETEAPTVAAATGGPLSRFVQGGGTGRSDSIDARLSDGEYVMDAETVSMLGDGSSKAGAQRLDQFRANIRKQKGRELAKGKFSPNAKRPEEYV